MMFGGMISRWFSMGGLCCLVVLGGLPRAWCLCPDAACRLACDTRSNLLAATMPSKSAPACCCCDRSQPAANLPAELPSPHCAAADCACEMHVTQLVLVAADRDVQSESARPAIWMASTDVAALVRNLSEAAAPAAKVALPPDDPVTRAQILRL